MLQSKAFVAIRVLLFVCISGYVSHNFNPSVHSVNSVAKYLFWLWFIALLILNTIPLGNGTNERLSSTRFVLRLDYLVHLMTFLIFSWVFILGEVTKKRVFSSQGVLKFTSVVVSAACWFEFVQKMLPYRAYNPIDMMFNLIGALIGIILIMITLGLSRINKVQIHADDLGLS